jgi:hypothetical protein
MTTQRTEERRDFEVKAPRQVQTAFEGNSNLSINVVAFILRRIPHEYRVVICWTGRLPEQALATQEPPLLWVARP